MTHQHREDAAPSQPLTQNKTTAQYVGFQLDDQQYAFPIQQIQEIVILDSVTCVPQVAEYVEGVSNLRGTIIPIINLRSLFGLAARPAGDETRRIVVNVGQRTMGCTVDSVSQVIKIPAERIQAPPDLVANAGTGYVAGFAKLDEQLIVLLNIDELLDPENLDAVHEAAVRANSASPGADTDASTA